MMRDRYEAFDSEKGRGREGATKIKRKEMYFARLTCLLKVLVNSTSTYIREIHATFQGRLELCQSPKTGIVNCNSSTVIG